VDAKKQKMQIRAISIIASFIAHFLDYSICCLSAAAADAWQEPRRAHITQHALANFS
jgi:hypothetical protein